MYLGVEYTTLIAGSVDDAIEQIETSYGYKFHERLMRSGISEKRRICDDSNILLNRVHIRQITDRSLKDGDKLDIIPRFVGG
jgi:molybdopterin converting factor small subunit